jgi:tetraacyldisaccharide 4'-kinase
VLDDGFQHVRLARNLDVLMTTPGEIMDGRVLPFGRLREGAEAASHADVLVVAGATDSDAAAEARSLGIARSCGAMRVLEAAEWVEPAPDPPVDLARLLAEHAPVVAVAGVAHPSRFFEGLESQGWVVTRRIPLADHHWFTASDVARIAAAVDESGARIVMTTEKDVVKLERLRPLPFPLASVPMRLQVEPATAVDRWIADARNGHDTLSQGERR